MLRSIWFLFSNKLTFSVTFFPKVRHIIQDSPRSSLHFYQEGKAIKERNMGHISNESSSNLDTTFLPPYKLLSDWKWGCLWTAGRLIRKDTKATKTTCISASPQAISKAQNLFPVFHKSPGYLAFLKISFYCVRPRYSYIGLTSLSNIPRGDAFNK